MHEQAGLPCRQAGIPFYNRPNFLLSKGQAASQETPARTERYVRAGLSRASFGMTVWLVELSL